MLRSIRSYLILFFIIIYCSTPSYAQVFSDTYEIPDGSSVVVIDKKISVSDLTQLGQNFEGISPAKGDFINDVDVTILSTWWMPKDRESFNSIHKSNADWASYSDQDFDKLIQDSRKGKTLRLFCLGRYRYNETESALVRYFILDSTEKISGAGAFVLEKVTDEWKISKPDSYVTPWMHLFMLMPPLPLAYMVTGDEAYLDRSNIVGEPKEKMIALRTNVLNEQDELLVNELLQYVQEVQDGFRDKGMREWIIVNPPPHMLNQPESVKIDSKTMVKIESDLAELDPHVREMVLEKLKTEGPLSTMNLLRNYGGMSLKDAHELVTSWVDTKNIVMIDTGDR